MGNVFQKRKKYPVVIVDNDEVETENQRFKSPFPPFIKNNRVSDVLYPFIVEKIEDAEKCSNYGDTLPLSVLHNIFLFLEIRYLRNIFLSSKLFWIVSHTNLFWRNYYDNWVKNKLFNIQLINEKENWMSVFFNEIILQEDIMRNEHYQNLFFCGGGATNFLLKILIVGEQGSGKTSLIHRFLENKFSEDRKGKSIDFHEIFINIGEHTRVKLEIWNPNRAEKEVRNSYFKGSHGFILCFDLDDVSSFKNISAWMEDITSFGDENCRKNVVVVGCKNDISRRKKKRMISRKEIQRKMIEFPILEEIDRSYCECSSKEGVCCILPFGLLIERIYKTFFNT